jgi:hypothetical protein
VKIAITDNAAALTSRAEFTAAGLSESLLNGLEKGMTATARKPMARIDDKALKVSVDKFLKSVCFTAQGEVEKAVRAAIAAGQLEGHETFTAGVSFASEKIGLNITIYSKIEL